MHVCLAVTCHLCFGGQSDWDLLHTTAVRWGGTNPKIKAQKVEPGEETAPAGIQTQDFSIMSPSLFP